MNSICSYLLLPMVGALVFAAASPQHKGALDTKLNVATISKTSAAPAPAVSSSGLLPDYRIGPGDVLAIDVWKEPDASTAATVVRPDGRVSLALLGELMVAGSTLQELQDSVSARYARIIRDARVHVTVREVNSQRVYVIGEVRREGAIRIVTPLTVLQALADSGGLTDYAKKKKIYILRADNGRQVKLPFDYNAVLRGRNVEQNITLLPGDTVVVPR
jgi:polysaccharide export outer membrane protein